ncbi:MAG: hypothetical protein AAFO02_24285, partial [Bacteroidota bacterium]
MKLSRLFRRNRNTKNRKKRKPFFTAAKGEETSYFPKNPAAGAVQKKGLTVGAVDSKEEKEADAVAKQTIQKQTEAGAEEKVEAKANVNRTKLATPKEYEKFGTKDQAMKHDRDIQEKPIQKQEEEPVEKKSEEEAQMKEEEPVQKKGEEEVAMKEEEPVQKMGEEEAQMKE